MMMTDFHLSEARAITENEKHVPQLAEPCSTERHKRHRL
uniref:Uncharacterized protein n=1 Tax=Anguilla anguilla TaxID=7936 RepID=A0A0E9QHT1_ANGAN